MALTPVQEAQVLDLIAQQSALLSLAGVEATILSKLGATKVTLSDLPTASVIDDADLLLLRQGVTDKSVTGLTFKNLIPTVVDASETVKGVVELSTDAEAQAYTANKVIDGAKLNTAFKGDNQSLAANGYQKLPGGLIFQWGISATSVANGVTINVTFPIAFPNACVVGHAIENSLVEIGASAAFNSTFTTTTLNVHNKDDAGAKAGFSWFAIGY